MAACQGNRLDLPGIDIQNVWAEALDMKADGGLDVGEGLFIGVTLTYRYAFDPQWIGNIAVRMPLDDDFESLQ